MPPAQNFNARADAVAIALRALELDGDPVAGVLGNVVDQRALGAEIHQERVDLAVVVVVGKAGAARRGAHAEHRAGLARNIFEMPFAHAAEQRVLLRDEVNEAAVKDEDVGIAVVVVVVNAGSPAHVLRVGLRDAVGRAHVFEALLCPWLCSRRL